MNCREAQTDIALHAGGDLDDRERVRALREHVGGCPECRAHYQGVKSSLKALSGLLPLEAGSATWQSVGSLWPSIRKELARPPETFTAAKAFNHAKNWSPFIAMTTACLVMLVALGRFGSPPVQPISNRGLTRPPISLQTPPRDDRSASERSESPSTRRSPQPRPAF